MACIAITSIPQGTYSKPFRPNEISTSSIQELRGNVKIDFPLQIGLSTSGEIQPVPQLPGIFWPKLMNIASDCHDENIKLCRRNNNETLILQATRDISVGQQLHLWFSEDLMITELGIPPYLSPFNIKSGNCYVCHECKEEFERPNLLKLHLALHCDRLSADVIWTRLKSMNTSAASALLGNPSYLLSLSPSSNVSFTSSSNNSPCLLFPISPASPPSSLHVKSSSSPPLQHHLHHQLAQTHRRHHSSLLPVVASSDVRHNNNNKGPVLSSSTPSPNIGIVAPVEGVVPMIPTSAVVEPEAHVGGGSRSSLVVQDQHHHHARLEAIVSNMGKAKNGHVCLYCGKLYSRKYGLKIHIRTHTGYKPLRCKICHRPFGDPSNLNKHVRLHSDGSTPYRCELCSKVLVRRRDLDRHMRARHGSSLPQIGGSMTSHNANVNEQCSIGRRTSTVTSSTTVSSSRL